MYKEKIGFIVKCEKHKRYDPSREGEDGIKGGCLSCHILLRIFKKTLEIKEIIKEHDEQ